MNARQRVQAVLRHELPDRVPMGLGGCETTGLHVLAYDTLQRLLHIPHHPPRMDTFMCNAVFEEDVLRAMDGDILLLASPRMCGAPLRGASSQGQWKQVLLWGRSIRVALREEFSLREDGTMVWESSGGKEICLPGTYFFDAPQPTDLTADFTYPDPEDYHPADSFPDEFLRDLEETARCLYEETEYSLCLGESVTDLQYAPGGTVGSMVLMLEEPDIMRAFLQRSVDAALRQITLLEQAVGRYVDMLSIAHDFGDNQGITIGEPLFREIYLPYYRQLFGGWHARTGMRINLHACGAMASILDDLIDCGLDVYNPVQISARGMDPAALKERFGDRLVFYGGGYDCQRIPVSQSYEEVYAQVSQTLEIFKRGGGYLFAGVHNLPATVPSHHLQALLDAWRDHRDYL